MRRTSDQSTPKLCPLSFSHDPSLLRPVPSTLRRSRRAGGFTAVLNHHGQLRERVGINGGGGFCLLSEAPLTFNLPSKLTHWPLLLMQSAAQQHQRQCQTHPLYLLWARCGRREVNFHQQTAAFGGINPHLLLLFRHKWFEIHDSSRNVKYGDLCSTVFFALGSSF